MLRFSKDELEIILKEDEERGHDRSEVLLEHEGRLLQTRRYRLIVLASDITAHGFYKFEEQVLVTNISL